ncbi:MAG: tetratricopeptide repeat protein [Bacteroidales bacterium]|jgi:tetratricopeptide (TPR) repeat protein
MEKNKKNIIILAIIFVIAIVVTYSNHFNNGFHFDDSHTIQNNIYITNINNIPLFFKDVRTFSSIPSHWGYRPLITTTLAIDYWLGGGLNPFYFHFSTFMWYVLMCVILFFVYKNILNKSINHKWTGYMAIVSVGWYALHTANAETINYIISRTDVLSTLCIVASLSIFISYPNLRKKFIYIIPAVIGVFCKETVLVLPLILFFYIILFEKELSLYDLFKNKNFKIIFKTILIIVPLLIFVLIFQIYTLAKTPPIQGLSNPVFYYILTQTYIWVHYFITFFLPFNLSADTDWGVITNIFDDRIIVGLIFIGLLIFTIFKTSQKKETKPIAFGLLWFALALLPTSVAPLSEVMNDHRMFFPFIGLAFSVVSCMSLLLLKYENLIASNKKYQELIYIIVFVVLSSYAYGTYQRNKVWKDEESLWHDVTIKSPMNGRGLMNYGLTQMGAGKYDVALSYFEKALIYNPYYSLLYINLGVLKNAMNKPAEAEEYFKKAITYGIGGHEPYYYYANFLFQHNRIGDARQMAEKSLSISPDFIQTRYLLMNMYNELGLWDNLGTLVEQTLQIVPNDAVTLSYLEASRKKMTKIDESMENAKKNPTPENYLSLSLTYYQKGLYEKCIEACNEALKLKPDYSDAYNNICSAYNVLGKYDEAIKACEKAIKIKPDYQLAKNNLAWAKSQIKK